jgi:hypothetical protein
MALGLKCYDFVAQFVSSAVCHTSARLAVQYGFYIMLWMVLRSCLTVAFHAFSIVSFCASFDTAFSAMSQIPRLLEHLA